MSSGRENPSEISKLESLESDLARGLDQINEDVKEFEHDEEKSSDYIDELGSLSSSQVEKLEQGFEAETFKGRKIIKELEKTLGMEEESVKALAQVLHRMENNSEEVEEKENEIDVMLENLKKKADKGEIDEELAAHCLAEIMDVKDEVKETAELEEKTADVSERLEQDLDKSHMELLEMKRDEKELEDELKAGENWAVQNDFEEMQRFVEKEGAPDLVSEIKELKNEIRHQQNGEDEFLQTMTELAEQEKLTERQIDHLITQQQEWSTVMKQVLKDGGSGFKKIGDALYGFTPAGMLMGAGKGAAQELDKDQVMNAVRKISGKIRGNAQDIETEIETSVQETKTARERLQEAKAS